jgi:hypothetical protein
VSFTVTLDPSQLSAARDALQYVGNGYQRATMRAANYAAARTKTATGKKLIALLTADAQRIKDSLMVKRATLANNTSVLDITGKAIPLFRFDVAFMYPTVKGGVTAKMFKTGIAPTHLKHAFVAKMKSGHVGVFSRETDARFPLREHFGPNAARAFEKTPGVENELVGFGGEQYLKELDRQVTLLFKKEYGIDPPEDLL